MISNKRLVEQYLSDLLQVYKIQSFEELKELDDKSIGAELKNVYKQFILIKDDSNVNTNLLALVNSSKFMMLGEKHYKLKSDLKTSYDSKERLWNKWESNDNTMKLTAFCIVTGYLAMLIPLGLILLGVLSPFLTFILPISIMAIIMFVPMITFRVSYFLVKEPKFRNCKQKLESFENSLQQPSEHCKKLREAIEKNATSLPAVVSPTVPTDAESQEPVNDATLAARALLSVL